MGELPDRVAADKLDLDENGSAYNPPLNVTINDTNLEPQTKIRNERVRNI